VEEDKDQERVDALFEKINQRDKIYSTEVEALKPEEVSRIEAVTEIAKDQERVDTANKVITDIKISEFCSEVNNKIAELQAEFVTQDEITFLKGQINSALSQLVELFVSLEDRFDTLDTRIAEYNRKSSHKL
jgi:vacuolar-type H+-ATPase subunit D/Vma8